MAVRIATGQAGMGRRQLFATAARDARWAVPTTDHALARAAGTAPPDLLYGVAPWKSAKW